MKTVTYVRNEKIVDSNDIGVVVEALVEGVPIVLTQRCFGCDDFYSYTKRYGKSINQIISESKTKMIGSAPVCGSQEMVEEAGKIYVEPPSYTQYGGVSSERYKQLTCVIEEATRELNDAEKTGRKKFHKDLLERL